MCSPLSVRYCAIEMATIVIIIIWNWPPNLTTNLGMVVYFHGLECAVERLDCYPLGQDDSEVQFLCLSPPHLLYQHIACYQKLACWCVVTNWMAPIGLPIMAYQAVPWNAWLAHPGPLHGHNCILSLAPCTQNTFCLKKIGQAFHVLLGFLSFIKLKK